MSSESSGENSECSPKPSTSTAANTSRVSGKRCVIYGCGNTNKDEVSLHTFPLKDPPILKQWVAFVRRKRAYWEGPTRYSCLCSAHFTAESYPMKYRILESAGKPVAKKDLIKGSVPTIDAVLDTKAVPSRDSSPKRRMAFTKRENKRVRLHFIFYTVFSQTPL